MVTNKKLSRQVWVTVAAALTAGLLTHMFALTNVLQNYDNINASFHGFGVGVQSGRWLLTFVSRFMHLFFGGYNIPWFNGLITLILLAVSAGFMADAFRLQKRSSAVLLGVLFVTFPTVASTLFFRFVSLYDALAVLMAVVAAWALEKYRWGIILSAICTACSMGIYQAYFPITANLLLALLLQKTLQGKMDFRTLLLRGCYYLGGMVAGLLAYFAAQRITMLLFHAQLLDYQGISEMGKISLTELPGVIANAYLSVIRLPFADYCSTAPNVLAHALVLLLWAFSLGAIVMLALRRCSRLHAVLLALICAVLPLAFNLIAVMAPKGTIYTLMTYGMVFLYLIPVVLAEELQLESAAGKPGKFRRAAAGMAAAAQIMLALAAFNYAYLTNVNYISMYYATRQTENYFNAMVVQIRMAEGFKASQSWAFVGDAISDPLIETPWEEIPNFGGNGTSYINSYSKFRWINTYFGYRVPLAEEEVVAQLEQNPQVAAMPCFPDEGSIKVIDDIVVIKIS